LKTKRDRGTREKNKVRFWSIFQVIVTIIVGFCAIAGIYLSCENKRIQDATSKPVLEVSTFCSFSLDIRGDEDLSRISRDRLTVEPTDKLLRAQEQESKGTTGIYQWLIVENVGPGYAKIFSIEASYKLEYGKHEAWRLEWKRNQAPVVGSGRQLAIFLGDCTGFLEFDKPLLITYGSLVKEDTLSLSFQPEDVHEHIRDTPTVEEGQY